MLGGRRWRVERKRLFHKGRHSLIYKTLVRKVGMSLGGGGGGSSGGGSSGGDGGGGEVWVGGVLLRMVEAGMDLYLYTHIHTHTHARARICPWEETDGERKRRFHKCRHSLVYKTLVRKLGNSDGGCGVCGGGESWWLIGERGRLLGDCFANAGIY